MNNIHTKFFDDYMKSRGYEYDFRDLSYDESSKLFTLHFDIFDYKNLGYKAPEPQDFPYFRKSGRFGTLKIKFSNN